MMIYSTPYPELPKLKASINAEKKSSSWHTQSDEAALNSRDFGHGEHNLGLFGRYSISVGCERSISGIDYSAVINLSSAFSEISTSLLSAGWKEN